MSEPGCLHCKIGEAMLKDGGGEQDGAYMLEALAEVIGDILYSAPVAARATLLAGLCGRLLRDVRDIDAGTYKNSVVRH